MIYIYAQKILVEVEQFVNTQCMVWLSRVKFILDSFNTGAHFAQLAKKFRSYTATYMASFIV